MLGKIGLKEHFATDETLGYFVNNLKNKESRNAKLLDILDLRLRKWIRMAWK